MSDHPIPSTEGSSTNNIRVDEEHDDQRCTVDQRWYCPKVNCLQKLKRHLAICIIQRNFDIDEWLVAEEEDEE
jgi:hypothetical protein